MMHQTDLACSEVERAIPWLLDDELEADYERDVEVHVSACEGCQRLLEREGRLRTTLQRASNSITAPARLRRRLNAAVDKERSQQGRAWMRYAPAAAAAVILFTFAWKGGVSGVTRDLDAAVMRHARNLPMDVIAKEPQQVQRYLSGKLPFAVRLPSLAEPPQNFGGRVTQLNERDAAYIRYETSQGRVSMFVYPDPGYGVSETAPVYRVNGLQVMMTRVRGYPAAVWRERGLVYSMVSDLPEADFQRILRGPMGRDRLPRAIPVALPGR